jgi:hypothetical protein
MLREMSEGDKAELVPTIDIRSIEKFGGAKRRLTLRSSIARSIQRTRSVR